MSGLREAPEDFLKMALASPHGGAAQAVEAALGLRRGELCDLSASISPVAPDFSHELTKALGALGRYPDSQEATLTMAQAIGVDPDTLVLTNGGSEAIALVAGGMNSAWAEELEFSLYRRHIRELDPAGPRFMSNPHNPTGVLAEPETRAEVIDEAFYPLATGVWTRGDSLRGSFVLGSLTKISGLPGLRIGYVIAPDPARARLVAMAQPKWSVSGIALAMVPAFVDRLDLGETQRSISGLRSRLYEVLRSFDLDYLPSDANYVFVPHARGLAVSLLREKILVRDCASFGRPDSVRIAVGTLESIERLRDALERRR